MVRTERDYLMERIGALEGQIRIYREWLQSLGALKYYKFDFKTGTYQEINKIEKEKEKESWRK